MERLIGKIVFSEVLGEGIITNTVGVDNHIKITVEFSSSQVTKVYAFPIVIGKALRRDEELLAIAAEIEREKDVARKKNEEAVMTAEQRRLKSESDLMVDKAKDIIAGIDRTPVFHTKDFNIYKVHQGKTYEEERNRGYVWAPEDGCHHHERLKDIVPGDIIFHYSEGCLVAVGEAVSGCFKYPCPAELAGYGWGYSGYRVEVRYEELSIPYSLTPHSASILANRAPKYSSFDIKGDACQGYMYELEVALARLFKSGILSQSQSAGVKRVLGRIL